MLIHNIDIYCAFVQFAPLHPPLGPLVVDYLGPDSAMPLASLLAALFGLLMIFWRYVTSSVRRVFRFLFRRNKTDPASTNETENDSPS